MIRSSFEGMFDGWGRHNAKGLSARGSGMRGDTTQGERGWRSPLTSSLSPAAGLVLVSSTLPQPGSCWAPGSHWAFLWLAWGQPAEQLMATLLVRMIGGLCGWWGPLCAQQLCAWCLWGTHPLAAGLCSPQEGGQSGKRGWKAARHVFF